MHETYIVVDLVRQIEKVAQANKASSVTALDIWLGALCHMDRVHFVDHFRTAAQGTVAEGAELRVSVSEDFTHLAAQDVILERIEVAD